MKTIAFFNNKGGVGKTTMVYHIAWMMAELGHRVLAVDLDPQSNLSSMFLQQERMEEIVLEEKKETILEAIIPISEGEPYAPVHVEQITSRLSLLIGNLSLSAFEDKLSDAWTKCLEGDIFGFKVTSVFKTIIDDAAARCKANFVLVDVGPNLGAINRAVLLAAEFVVLPVAADMFSLQGIKNLGKTLHTWRIQWTKRTAEYTKDVSSISSGRMLPIGYVLVQYTSRERRPVKSYIKWADRIPDVYNEFIERTQVNHLEIDDDDHCLAMLKHYHSLIPMAMEAHKPLFLLKPADGAIGSHLQAVKNSYADFQKLTKKIIARSKSV